MGIDNMTFDKDGVGFATFTSGYKAEREKANIETQGYRTCLDFSPSTDGIDLGKWHLHAWKPNTLDLD